MSSPSFQTPDLDPTQARTMLDTVLAALPAIPNVEPEVVQSQQRAATDLLRELQPVNGIEALLAAHVVASHYAAMDAWRRACDPALSNERVHTLRGDARSLARLAKDTLLTLQRGRHTKRNRAPQSVVPVTGAAEASGPGQPLASPRDTAPGTKPGHNPIHQFAPPSAVAASLAPEAVPPAPPALDQAIPPNHEPAHNPIHQFAPAAAASQAPEAVPPAPPALDQAVPPKSDSGNKPHTPVRHTRRTRFRRRRHA